MDDKEGIYVDIEDKIDDTEEAEVVLGLIMEKLGQLPSRSSECSICRVPTLMFKENPEAYIPHMVSIGPIHHDQKHLQPMETRKMQYFESFLDESSPGKLKNYVKVVTELADRAYRCYPEVKIERKSFVMMMVVDGCFILHLLLNYKDLDYSDDESCWVEFALLDLLLVENQLPFFVLEELYQVFIADDSNGSPADTCTLQDVVCQSLVTWVMRVLFDSDTDEKTNCANAFNQIPPMGKPKHLLDFTRKFIVPSLPRRMWQQQGEKNNQKPVVRATRCLCRALACVIRSCKKKEHNLAEGYKVAEPMWCAMELKNASVKFEKNKNPTSLLDINFDYSKGVLTVPPILVQDTTEPILRNLIAYEFFSDDYNYITEYMIFLNSLINSGKDVELLQESGIFSAILAHPGDVAKLFDSLNKYTSSGQAYTDIVSRKLMKYSSRRWNKWKASLIHNYFNTPWALVSVVAAIVLLILTFTQTIFAILSYH